MNRHELVDVVTIRLSGLLLGDAKLFSRSLASPPVGEVIEGATVPDAEPLDPDDTAVRTLDVETPVGTFEAAYRVERWLGPTYPTLCYHHGSGEDPFEDGRFASNSFRRLFATEAFAAPVNLLAVRAPFHDRSARAYAGALADLSNFVGMVAASTALLEALRLRLAEAGSPGVTVSGISLGGFVANLHRAYVGGADRYVPMLAGAALGELFVTSVYRHLTGERAKANPERLREVLDFADDFRGVDGADCAPLLARHDRIVEYDRQQPSYAGMDVGVMEKGHVTGALATDALRGWVRRNLAEGGRVPDGQP